MARDILNRLETIDSAMRDFAADQLLELKNETWREEGEPELTKADFTVRMSILKYIGSVKYDKII